METSTKVVLCNIVLQNNKHLHCRINNKTRKTVHTVYPQHIKGTIGAACTNMTRCSRHHNEKKYMLLFNKRNEWLQSFLSSMTTKRSGLIKKGTIPSDDRSILTEANTQAFPSHCHTYLLLQWEHFWSTLLSF